MTIKKNVTLGKHAIIDLSGCDPAIINNTGHIQTILRQAAQLAQVTIVGTMDHYFTPEGYTAVLVLEESHLSIHTWPEYNYASIDLYSCNLQTDFEGVKNFLAAQFRASMTGYQLLERGFAVTPHRQDLATLG